MVSVSGKGTGKLGFVISNQVFLLDEGMDKSSKFGLGWQSFDW